MISAAHITRWAKSAPWPTREQVEQDLVLSRLIVEIASHPLLGDELVFRGGTCLHKLHLTTPRRYSYDRITAEATLAEHLSHPGFRGDLAPLTEAPDEYDLDVAADLITTELLARL